MNPRRPRAAVWRRMGDVDALDGAHLAMKWPLLRLR